MTLAIVIRMKPYAKIKTKKTAQFERLVGIFQENFRHVVNWLKSYQSEIKKHTGLKIRRLNTSKVSLEDRVLLTFYYLRHYPTFDNLAPIFNISESYCQKIYTKTVETSKSILFGQKTLPHPQSPTHYLCFDCVTH